jgi:NAD(P)-dependent dehydrogenase (short-subunit alcohol dehydrogenase family)
MKTVLITGVSSGIGRATALLMARRGWRVIGTSREPSTVTLPATGDLTVLRVALADRRSMRNAVERVVNDFGSIDVLVNNAAYGVYGPVEGVTDDELDLQFRTNVIAPIELARLVLPHMRRAGSGVIVNVSSVGGRIAMPFASLYHASKFAIEGFSESFRYEIAPFGIRVKLIEPGAFQTGFISRSLHLSSHDAYDDAFANHMKWVRRGNEKAPPPEAVANTIIKAILDPSQRLRYRVRASAILTVSSVLPDRLWSRFVRMSTRRAPR